MPGFWRDYKPPREGILLVFPRQADPHLGKHPRLKLGGKKIFWCRNFQLVRDDSPDILQEKRNRSQNTCLIDAPLQWCTRPQHRLPHFQLRSAETIPLPKLHGTSHTTKYFQMQQYEKRQRPSDPTLPRIQAYHNDARNSCDVELH